MLTNIFAKLDGKRVEQIIRFVSGDDLGAIFITNTNRGHLDKNQQGSSFSYKICSIEGGEIKEKEG